MAANTATRSGTDVKIAPASPEKSAETTFIMLKDSRISFEGTLSELQASTDPYLKDFLS